jgi:hypothetical protein
VISSHISANARILQSSSTKRIPAFTKNDTRPTQRSNSSCDDRAAARGCVEDGHGVHEREGQLLRRRRAGLLQVVAADVRGVPARNRVQAVLVHVGDEPHGVRRREDVRAARKVLLDDVVLGRALELRRVDARRSRQRDVER